MTKETQMNTHCRYLNTVEKGWDAAFVTSILQGTCLKYYCCKETFALFFFNFSRGLRGENLSITVENSFKLPSLTVISVLKTTEIIAKIYSRLHCEWQVCALQITPVKFRENGSPVFGSSPSWCLSLFMGLPERFIQHFHIDHNAPWVPPPPKKKKKNLPSSSSCLGTTVTPRRKSETMLMQNFGG